MRTDSRTSFAVLAAAALLLSSVVPALAGTTDVSIGGTYDIGDYTVSGANDLASELNLFTLLSVSNGYAETSGLTTGDIYDLLVSGGVSQAYALEFALNTNETGQDASLTVDNLALTFGGKTYSLDSQGDETVNVPYANGASRVEAFFRADLGYDFLEAYSSSSTDPFSLSAWHSQYSDGPDVYSLHAVSVSPEPVSSALFLLGGVPLAAAFLRKKKKI